MKKLMLSIFMLSFALVASAQVTIDSSSVTEPVVAKVTAAGEPDFSRVSWLQSFDRVVISAPVDITFARAEVGEAPQIAYDTKGAVDSKFTTEVRDRVLYITEKFDPKREKRTAVKIWYNSIRMLKVTDARVSFEGLWADPVIDLHVGARSDFSAEVAAKDLLMDLSGESLATLTGSARYLDITASTGKADLKKMEVMSARVVAQNGVTVTLHVTERLEGRASGGSSVLYRGMPMIMRVPVKSVGRDFRIIE